MSAWLILLVVWLAPAAIVAALLLGDALKGLLSRVKPQDPPTP